MFFELNGKTYGVKFHRENTTTYAEIVEVKEQIGMVHLGCFGVARLHPNDRFVKSTGRKIALTNLLNALSDPTWQQFYPKPRLNRETRKIAWEAYFKTHKK